MTYSVTKKHRELLLSTLLIVGGIDTVGAANFYFVDASHHDASNTLESGWGKSDNKPWKTISYAASQIRAGDTVFVKAATYGTGNDNDPNVNGFFDADGVEITVSNVSFIGYNESIYTQVTTDLSDGSGIPKNYAVYKVDLLLDILDKMPIIDGGDRNDGVIGVTIGNGKKLDAPITQVYFENFRIKNFEGGIHVVAPNGNQNVANCFIRNVLVSEIGNLNVDTGQGIRQATLPNNITYTNCFVINAGHCAFNIYGDANIIRDCQVYADDNSSYESGGNGYISATDYYYNISGDNNLIEDCHAERAAAVYHGGHGYVVQGIDKDQAWSNTFKNCTAVEIDEPILLRGRNAKFNVFENITCTVNADLLEESVGGTSGRTLWRRPWGGITLVSGPWKNKFRRIRINNGRSGIKFNYSSITDANADWSAKDNSFESCIFEIANESSVNDPSMIPIGNKNSCGILFASLHRNTTRKVINNKIVNCTFSSGDVFIIRDRLGENNDLVNCIVGGDSGNAFPFSSYEHSESGASLPHDLRFEHCCFYNPGAGFPTGRQLPWSNVEVEPNFDYGFVLDGSSQLIDNGDYESVDYFLDYSGGPRIQNYNVDIGADEYPN